MQPFFWDSSQHFQQLIHAHSSYITFNELENHLSIFFKRAIGEFPQNSARPHESAAL